MQIHGSLSVVNNNELIIGKPWHKEVKDSSRYLFKSKPFNYNQFNWAVDYLVLPSIPTALASFNGRCYAFDENNTYIINTSGSMFIEDTYNGVGCINNDSHIVTEYGMFFADTNNIYWHDGKQPNPIGDAISTGYTVGYADRSSGRTLMAFDGKTNTLMVFFIDGSTNSKVWAYNLARKRWDLWESTSHPSSLTHGKDGEVIISDSTGIKQYNRNSSTYRNLLWFSKPYTMNTDTQSKSFKTITWNGSVSAPAVYVDGALSTLETTDKRSKLTSNKNGKSIQLTWTGVDGGEDLIESFGIVFRRKTLK